MAWKSDLPAIPVPFPDPRVQKRPPTSAGSDPSKDFSNVIPPLPGTHDTSVPTAAVDEVSSLKNSVV